MKEKKQGKGKNIAETVAALIKDAVEDCGCTLWDVELVKEGADLSLVVSIDKEGGVSLEDCEMVNDAVNPIIDEADPISESYFLEISSAGLERDLRKPEQIEAYVGKKVSLKLYAPVDGRKQIEGELLGYDAQNKSVKISCEAGELEFEMSKIAQLKNTVDF